MNNNTYKCKVASHVNMHSAVLLLVSEAGKEIIY